MASGFQWAGDSLADAVDGMIDEVHTTGYRLAETGLDRFEHNVEINTPVKTRKLRQSYKQTPVDYVLAQHGIAAAYCWEGTVFTEVTYAEYVERGTGLWGPRHAKYKIEPKEPGGVLRFRPYMRAPDGSVLLNINHGVRKHMAVYAKFVMHPGSPGAAMFRIGATLTEAQADEWSRGIMAQWKRQMELQF